ncbi:MAG: pyrroloquinoline quinone biosynthesis peptide chaperone PqqD [Gemmatimonadetes bacterium]|nr:pyrroloquinoline quinone biosynthesis peptide chaperone PqqD [Gemmatimonadota bacterium]
MPSPSARYPRLWPLARLGHDRVRNRPVLLYPEGAMFINTTGQAILALCDGSRTLDQVVAALTTQYQAEVRADVLEYLETMARRDLIQWLEAPAPVSSWWPSRTRSPAAPRCRRTSPRRCCAS